LRKGKTPAAHRGTGAIPATRRTPSRAATKEIHWVAQRLIPSADGVGRVPAVEVLIATFLLVGGLGTLLFGMYYAMIHAEYVRQAQVAMNAAQGLLERLSATGFDTLTGPQYAAARTGVQRCPFWDLNCNGVLEAGEIMDNPDPLPGGALDLQIRQPADDVARNGAGNPMLLDLHVAACWQSHGHAVSEDRDCNGVLDPVVEDGSTPLNPVANTWVDSPVMVSTRMGRQD